MTNFCFKLLEDNRDNRINFRISNPTTKLSRSTIYSYSLKASNPITIELPTSLALALARYLALADLSWYFSMYLPNRSSTLSLDSP